MFVYKHERNTFFFSEWLKAVAVYYFGRLDEPSKEPRFSNFNVAGNSEKTKFVPLAQQVVFSAPRL